MGQKEWVYRERNGMRFEYYLSFSNKDVLQIRVESPIISDQADQGLKYKSLRKGAKSPQRLDYRHLLESSFHGFLQKVKGLW